MCRPTDTRSPKNPGKGCAALLPFRRRLAGLSIVASSAVSADCSVSGRARGLDTHWQVYEARIHRPACYGSEPVPVDELARELGARAFGAVNAGRLQTSREPRLRLGCLNRGSEVRNLVRVNRRVCKQGVELPLKVRLLVASKEPGSLWEPGYFSQPIPRLLRPLAVGIELQIRLPVHRGVHRSPGAIEQAREVVVGVGKSR